MADLRPSERRGDPNVAVLLTWFLPGAGHVYLGAAVPGFVQLLHDCDFRVRLIACQALRFLGPEAAPAQRVRSRRTTNTISRMTRMKPPCVIHPRRRRFSGRRATPSTAMIARCPPSNGSSGNRLKIHKLILKKARYSVY